jgi:hypothetical protein
MPEPNFSLSGSQRLHLINVLPQEAGSLKESIQIKRLRDRIGFSDGEEEKIEMDEETGSFNPRKLQNLPEKEFSFGENEREIIAGSIIQREDEGEVPTTDAFVELVLDFEEEIEEFRADLDSQEDDE